MRVLVEASASLKDRTRRAVADLRVRLNLPPQCDLKAFLRGFMDSGGGVGLPDILRSSPSEVDFGLLLRLYRATQDVLWDVTLAETLTVMDYEFQVGMGWLD